MLMDPYPYPYPSKHQNTKYTNQTHTISAKMFDSFIHSFIELPYWIVFIFRLSQYWQMIHRSDSSNEMKNSQDWKIEGVTTAKCLAIVHRLQSCIDTIWNISIENEMILICSVEWKTETAIWHFLSIEMIHEVRCKKCKIILKIGLVTFWAYSLAFVCVCACACVCIAQFPFVLGKNGLRRMYMWYVPNAQALGTPHVFPIQRKIMKYIECERRTYTIWYTWMKWKKEDIIIWMYCARQSS